MKRRTILIVDDDPDVRHLLVVALRFYGFDTLSASDGWEALQLIQQQRPALIVLDLNMPRIDGGAVLRELAAHDETRGIPVIVVTGAEAGDIAMQARAILKKPIAPHHLIPIIQQYVHA